MRHWAFRDFLSEHGRNTFREWLDSQPVGAQMDLDGFLRHLETLERLGLPHMKKLIDEDGLFELRYYHKRTNIQYRPIVFYGPDRKQITLLVGAIERGNDFEPRDAKRTARLRKLVVERDHARTCQHQFD
jgi:hypothetical protein